MRLWMRDAGRLGEVVIRAAVVSGSARSETVTVLTRPAKAK